MSERAERGTSHQGGVPSPGDEGLQAEAVPEAPERGAGGGARRSRRPRGRRPVQVVGPALVVAALGVRSGDIGTSPLYALQTVFTIDQGAVRPRPATSTASSRRCSGRSRSSSPSSTSASILRADNEGEGGVMALAPLARRLSRVWGRGGPRHLLALGVLCAPCSTATA